MIGHIAMILCSHKSWTFLFQTPHLQLDQMSDSQMQWHDDCLKIASNSVGKTPITSIAALKLLSLCCTVRFVLPFGASTLYQVMHLTSFGWKKPTLLIFDTGIQPAAHRKRGNCVQFPIDMSDESSPKIRRCSAVELKVDFQNRI